MAVVLENVLNEHLNVNVLKDWLITESFTSSDLNETDKEYFILFFINYIREKCKWLVLKNIKITDSPVKPVIKRCDEKINNAVSNDKENHLKKSLNSYPHNRQNSRNLTHRDEKWKNSPKYNFEDYKRNLEGACNNHEFHVRKSLNFGTYNKIAHLSGLEKKKSFVPDLSNIDAFPPIGPSSNAKQEHKTFRRITPTPIKTVHNDSVKFGQLQFRMHSDKISNEIFKRTPVVDASNTDLQKEREMLKITRDKLSLSSVVSNNFSEHPVEPSPVKSINVQYIVPDPEKVSRKKELLILSDVYSFLITHSLVLNVTTELYFIFEVLISRVLLNDEYCNNQSALCSVHNCVFFGIDVLGKLQSLLSIFDNTTLSSLREIPYLPKFSFLLSDYLKIHCDEKHKVVEKGYTSNRVPFFLEEDSRDNFIDDQTFSSFKKQRDLFYELLRDWQNQSDYSDFKFNEKFSRKAQNLINLGPNAVNMYHLARLFQAQLIASCLCLEVNDVYDDILSDIHISFPGKIAKLRERFMTPFCVGEPNPPPKFYGMQLFFCQLIQSASSTVFNQQLQDLLIFRILELNGTDILSDGEPSVFGALKEKYIFLLHSMRLLGKFLGYLYFLPYTVCESLPASFVNFQLITRKKILAPLDLPELLKEAVESQKIILTAPWIIEFLSMADPVALQLPYINESLKILTAIYRGNFIPAEGISFSFMQIIIGWLFDVIHYQPNYDSQKLIIKVNFNKKGVDSLPLIDKQLLHSCCPFLGEFKVLLYNFLNGIRGKNRKEVRKITPLSTVKPKVLLSSMNQQVELKLEENFFFIHPPSLKKTVEFVSERMSSKVINRIRSEVTNFKLNCVEFLTENKKMLCAKEFDKIDESISEMYKELKTKINDFIQISCIDDIKSLMPYLLPHDIKAPVLKLACEITHRLAVDRIFAWCEANLLIDSIKSDIKNKLSHLSKGESDAHDGNYELSDFLNTLRRLTVRAFINEHFSEDECVEVLKVAAAFLVKALGGSIKKMISFLTVDLFMSILYFHVENCSNQVFEAFISTWSCSGQSLERYYLSVMNITLFQTAKNWDLSSEKYCLILTKLLDKKTFCKEELKNCVDILSSITWDDLKSVQLIAAIKNILPAKKTAKN